MARLCLLIVLLGAWWCSPVFADTVYVVDGSVLKGDVVTLDTHTLVLDTAYAGNVHIERQALRGITTDEPMRLTQADGDVVLARLAYTPGTQEQHMVIGGDMRPLSFKHGAIRLACTACANEQVTGTASTATATAPSAEAPGVWSGAVKFGLNGNAGNTETRSLQLGFTALREAGRHRLLLSAALDRQMEDDQVTADEIQGMARYEYDFSPRLFGYVMERLSHDEFNQIELRSRTTVGLGYYLVRDARTSFKVRTGLGYEHETFTSGRVERDAIVGLGWDYWHLFGEWLELKHEFTIFREVSDFAEDNFTIDSVLGVQVPLADSNAWSMALELTHEYSNNPPAGIEALDTSYMLGIVREFE